MNKPQLLVLALFSTLLLSSGSSNAAIYQPPAQDACGNYAAKAVYQFRNQRMARCGFSGPRWNENGAGQHHWCRTVRPAVTEASCGNRGGNQGTCYAIDALS